MAGPRWRDALSVFSVLAFRRRTAERVISVRKGCGLLCCDSAGPERLCGGETSYGRDGDARASHFCAMAELLISGILWSLVLVVVSSTGESGSASRERRAGLCCSLLLLGLSLVFLIIDTNTPRIEDTFSPDHQLYHPPSSLHIVNLHTT